MDGRHRQLVPHPAIAQRVDVSKLISSARREILALVPQGSALPATPQRPGVGVRLVVQGGVSHLASLHPHVRSGKAGVQVRVHDDVPVHLVIVDGDVVALSRKSAVVDLGRLPHLMGAASALRVVFEAVWRDAAPHRQPRKEVRPVHRCVLERLADGASDEEIATSLGCSVRTVQRHVAVVMRTFQARSRLQLGFIWARAT